jgi:protein-L-isoaspartate(D-aspartate) O-methyltransferase
MSDRPDFHRMMQFVLALRQGGVSAFAFEDRALPLADGATMTRPSLVARMLQALELRGGETVLEVGTGSGYQAAVLAAIARRVASLERRRTLAGDARARIGQLRLMHVYVHGADGNAGWADDAPYDAIVINASIAEPPEKLVAQLAATGVLVAAKDGRLTQWRKGVDGALAVRDLGPADLAPLETGVTD